MSASDILWVTEDDIRRSRFPSALLKSINETAKIIETKRRWIAIERVRLQSEETDLAKLLDKLEG